MKVYKESTIYKIIHLYVDGIKNMPKWAKILWLIIFIKLIFMFGFMRPVFFNHTLSNRYQTDQERVDHVISDWTSH